MAAIKGRNVKQMYQEAGSLRKFETKFKELLGIKEDPITSKRYVDRKARQMGTEEFSIRDLTEQFLGYEFVSELHGGSPSSSKSDILAAGLHGSMRQRLLMEDIAPVTPSVFQDINAWNATVAGLVEVRLLENYNHEDYIADNFMETQPTKVNGGKMQGIPYVAPFADQVNPGEEFPNCGLNEQWVWARPNLVIGEKLSLDRNTVVYDLGGELMAKADSLGLGLGYVKEYYCGCGILGITAPFTPASGFPRPKVMQNVGNSFRMNVTLDSTPNPTYQTAGITTNPNLTNAYNYINQQSNVLQDWQSLQSARSLLNLMRDPFYQLPFQTAIRVVYVDPSNWDLILRIKHATQVYHVTGTPAVSPDQGAGSTFPPNALGGSGFPAGSELNGWIPHKSNIWHQILLDAGVTEANSKIRWLAGDPKKAFVWRSAWDARVDQANPSSSELLGRNVVNEWVAQYSGQFVVREPRHMINNTN